MSKFDRAPARLACFLSVTLLAGLLGGPALGANAPRDPLNGRQSYSGSNMNCLIANDFYVIHFTALQPGTFKNEATPFEKYCQEVPQIGKTYLTMDLLDRDVRSTPISLRVVEEEFGVDGTPTREIATLAEVPAKIYKNGTADTQVDITKPGHYALIASIGEDAITEDDRLRIPFSVGLPSPSKSTDWMGKLTAFITIAFFGTMALIGFRTWRAYRRPKAAEADALRYPPA
ncbi:hypothetical protein [Methyloterricola oryzae]|uniref:hypothetical protein n=1 Tax=Methyloterricola oryzae TaxID=1495050 RepID=UPI000699F0D3|nr:hypothetical protein [Methyloterricola oryzae]